MIIMLYMLLFVFVPYGGDDDRPELNILKIPTELLKNANTVVRYSEVHHGIKKLNERTTKVIKTITVLNEDGKWSGAFRVGYSEKSEKVKDIKILLYDAAGKKILKVDKDDIEDHSSSYGSLATSGRYKSYQYTANKYPYTIHYEYTLRSSNTLSLQPWRPVFYNQSVEFCEYKVSSVEEFPIMTKLFNFENTKSEIDNLTSTYSLSQYPAIKYETMAPHYKETLPHMLICPNQFSFEGIKGEVSSWRDFGNWFYQLNETQDDISDEMINEMNSIIDVEDDDYTKARKIYDYVAENMRYVSIQLGIGGFQPFPAEEVHQLKYGDCKGLSNYTKTLMNHFGIKAVYTVIESNGKYNYDFDVSMPDLGQGNHVILCLPELSDTTFVECTSKDLPFGYISSSNNNRNVLLVSEEGGKIVKTTRYQDQNNVIENKLDIVCDEVFNAKVMRSTQYRNLALDPRRWRTNLSKNEQEKLVAKYELDNVIKYDLEKYSIEMSRDEALIEEQYLFSIPDMAKKVANYKMLPINLFSLSTSSPISEDRIHDIYVKDGYKYDIDINYTIPEGYKLVTDNTSLSLDNNMGSVTYDITMINKTTVNVKAEILQKSGKFNSSLANEYNSFQDAKRKFIKTTIVLKPKN